MYLKNLSISKLYKIGVLSAGSQSSISIIKSLANLKKKYNIQICAFDMSNYSAGLYLADTYEIIPRFNSKNYIRKLIYFINKRKLNYLFPQLDCEIKLILKNKKNIENKTNCKIIINNSFSIHKSLNKKKANTLCINNKIHVPKIYDYNEVKKLNYDKLIYRKNESIGSRGIKIYLKKNIKNLTSEQIKKHFLDGFFQKFQNGEEYSIDIVINKKKPAYIIPRLRQKIVNGQITIGKVCLNKKLIKFSKKIIKLFKITNHACLQCIYHNNKIYFIELNPRFGTGMTFSELAGAYLIEPLIFKYRKKLNYQVKEIKVSRYWSEVLIK